MKKKILIMTAAALLTLGLATVSAQSPAPAEQAPEEIIYEIVEPQRYEAETPAYTVDENGNVTLDVKIHLIGDITGDGKILANDNTLMMRHIRKTSLLTGYQLKCADITGDGKILANDNTLMMRHIRKTALLWELN